MAEATNLHTPEQIQQKRDAIDNAIRQLAFDYIHGSLASHPQLMYNRIDDLHALLSELRRG
jgi:hypothetical protein